MKRQNPFTPALDEPQFFGRNEILLRVESALLDNDSPDRILFITGPRGCGLSHLLRQFSQIAASHEWLVIDVRSHDAVREIKSAIQENGAPASMKAILDASELEASALQDENSHLIDSKGARELTRLFLFAAKLPTAKGGIFITIDEVQKVSKEDMMQICYAVETVASKGYAIALMMAGLPGSKELVSSYPGCTFLLGVRDEHIGSLTVDETLAALRGRFSRVRQFEIGDELLYEVAEFSQGYPYLIQLTGYYLVEMANKLHPLEAATITSEDVARVKEEVYPVYRENILVPATRSLGSVGRAYLAAMAKCMDDDGVVSTGDVAKVMERSLSQLSSCREILINRRLVRPVGYGKVRFGLPHLSRFAAEFDEKPKQKSGEWSIK